MVWRGARAGHAGLGIAAHQWAAAGQRFERNHFGVAVVDEERLGDAHAGLCAAYAARVVVAGDHQHVLPHALGRTLGRGQIDSAVTGAKIRRVGRRLDVDAGAANAGGDMGRDDAPVAAAVKGRAQRAGHQPQGRDEGARGALGGHFEAAVGAQEKRVAADAAVDAHLTREAANGAGLRFARQQQQRAQAGCRPGHAKRHCACQKIAAARLQAQLAVVHVFSMRLGG